MGDDEELTRRAFAAWYRYQDNPDQPSNDSGVVEHAGLKYVVLRNMNGPLAVYRVTNRGALRLMKRPPADILT